MKLSFIVIYIVFLFCLACNANQNNSQNNKENYSIKHASKDSFVHIKKDSMGRVVEKWGNEKSRDNDMNFRFFYTYDKAGNLLEEKRYFFDDKNVECKIDNKEDYEELLYFYELKGDLMILIKSEKYIPKIDKKGNITGRELCYIYDHKKEDYTFHIDMRK